MGCTRFTLRCQKSVVNFSVRYLFIIDLFIYFIIIIIIIIIIITIFLHGLGRLTSSGIDALSSFPGTSTISSSSGFEVEGVFRESVVLITGLKWPRGFQEVKVHRFHDNDTG